MEKNVVIFASGTGSNADTIIKHFENNTEINITAIITNKKDAGVIEVAKKYNIPYKWAPKSVLNSTEFNDWMSEENPDLIILAGFLLKFPTSIIRNFPDKIINIHPALLPKFGGKGMYGMNVHNAVIEANESESGITIHYVNEHYDEGKIIFQDSVEISENDTPQSVQKKVQVLEHKHFPLIIEDLLTH